MDYKNIKTGATFSSPCVVRGGNWVLVEEGQLKTTEPEEFFQSEDVKQVETKNDDATDTPENAEDFDGITRVQIMQELDAFGIEYDKKANKKVLYDLMMQGK